MQWLPELTGGDGSLTLPLCDRTAGQISAALLADDRAVRGARFNAVLEQDPAFALWSICRADRGGQRGIRAIAGLADWLAAAAPRELQWQTPPGQDFGPSSAPAGDSWADLSATSLCVADISRQICRQVGLDPARAYLLGLLHAADVWIASSAVGSIAADPGSWLPGWLTRELDTIGAAPAGQIVTEADCVALAIQARGDERVEMLERAGISLATEHHPAIRAQCHSHWQQAADHVPWLPDLTAKLARLKQLESDFHGTLEREKLEALKELAYGAGHEINNPLANISARAQTLLHEERDAERRRKLAAINTQAFRAHEMIADMMLFARPPRPKLAPLDVNQLISIVVGELAHLAAAQNTQIVFHARATATLVSADKTQLAVALRALCINALEALVTGGHVEVTLTTAADATALPAKFRATGETVQIAVSDTEQIAVSDTEQIAVSDTVQIAVSDTVQIAVSDTVQIAVCDTGPGISPEVRRHLFDPFFSGREAGRGLGFGLSKCWQIISMHGGQIEVENTSSGGARFVVSLPSAVTS